MGSRFSLLFGVLLASALIVLGSAPRAAQEPSVTDYVVGPQDVLTITSYDQADLSGKFAIEADGTFTFPLIGRLKVGGLTLRGVEAEVKRRLKEDEYFKDPQITVAVDQYRSQKIFIVGEVRSPGMYSLSGDMTLIEALSRAGSTLSSASGEAVIVRADQSTAGPVLPKTDDLEHVVRVDLRKLENGALSLNPIMKDGDTIFVPRAEAVYVFGQVKTPGAYSLQQKNTTVLQALSLAGGVTDRGSTSRINIVRIVNGDKKEFRVKLGDIVQPGDTIIVSERFF